MTLDEIERLAREVDAKRIEAEEFCRKTGNHKHVFAEEPLARAVLAMLPVVRSAEAWRDEIARKPRPTDAEVRLANAVDKAIDTMRAALAEGE